MILPPETETLCDVAVIGGGPAGATVARMIAAWGLDVVVIEAGAARWRKGCEVLGAEAEPVLRKIDLLDRLDAAGPVARRCAGVVTRWPKSGAERQEFAPGGDGSGWIVDRPLFDDLLRRLAVEARCRWLAGARLRGVACERRHFELVIQYGGARRLVRARYAVDASGRPASLARRLGARRSLHDVLVAVGCTTELGNGAPGVLSIAASPQRWQYSIEGPGSTFRAVVIDPRLDAPNPEALARFHGLHGADTRDGTQRRVATLEASSVCLDRVAGPRWLAVGDAAAAFDPFSGQGLGQAFGSALAAAHAIHADAGGDTDAFAIYAGAVHATYRHSRHLLDRRYAFIASCEGGPFWTERVRHAFASTPTNGQRREVWTQQQI